MSDLQIFAVALAQEIALGDAILAKAEFTVIGFIDGDLHIPALGLVL